MKELKIKLEHCYGIKKLEHEFDFSDCKTFVIYAPNGVMKTSFAKTAKTLFDGKTPCDQVNPYLESQYNFLIDSEQGTTIDPKQFCVIEPYNEKVLDSEKNILILLADDNQRERYLKIYKEIEGKKANAFSGLRKISGSSNFGEEILGAFADLKKENIYEILEEIFESIERSAGEFDFAYNDIFDSKGNVKKFLSKHSKTLEDYFQQYKSLIESSSFFSAKDGVTFGTAEAKSLNKSLEGGEYFSVGYGLSLNDGESITDQNKLKETIDKEISSIFADPNLKDIFDKIDKDLDGNAELRKFKIAINKNPELLTRLKDYEGFRKVVWYSFLKEIQPGVEELIEFYNSKKDELKKLIDEANKNKGAWQDAIAEFKNRFVDMPFEMYIKNIPDAVLKNETPTLEFSYIGKTIDRQDMVENILSQGEKRAFYLLNVIFGIKSRKLQDKETLFIIDDIADSFDYKNKYAIVEYLSDLSKEENFYSIILTHNFDFYRTICSRLNTKRKNRLHAMKNKDEIILNQEVYQNAPFKTWKECMSVGIYYDKNYSSADAIKHIIALVPFVRNLIEYGVDHNVSGLDWASGDFDLLTKLLHKKSGTEKVNFGHLKKVYKQYLGKDDFDSSIGDDDIVFSKIEKIANDISDTDFNLEDKIILAIAIRLKAEKYMWSKVANKEEITGNQTGKLFQRYKDEFKEDKLHTNAIRTLESVNIMTPENIHLNSFMYEPILDMGIDELKNLYTKICQLS